MTRYAVVCLVLIMGAGCAAPPAKYDFENSIEVAADYDSVWAAAVETFAEFNIPIKTIEKASGLIAAEKVNVGEANADCGKPAMGQRFGPIDARFNVFLRSLSDIVKVTMTSEFGGAIYESGMIGGTRAVGSVTCNSTGELEGLILESIRSRI